MNIEIFIKLFYQLDAKNPLIDHVSICIYGLLKKHIMKLLSTEQKDSQLYIQIKNSILKLIKEKYLSNSNFFSDLLKKNISDCLSVLIISGIFHNWMNCIPELIEESSKNAEFCYITLRALSDIDLLLSINNSYNINKQNENFNTEEIYTESSVNIQSKQKLQIKDKLIDSKKLVINFMLSAYRNINGFQNDKLKNNIINSIIDLTKCWTHFDLYLLKSPEVYQMIFNIINNYQIKNFKKFSEMICESITNSKNSKIYSSIIDDPEKYSPEKISGEIIQNLDKEEKKGMDDIIDFIIPKFEDYKNNTKNYLKNEYNQEKIFAYSSIFSCIIENYTYLFFDFNHQRSGILLQWFKYFLTCSKKKISWMFFEGLNEMREFINTYYKFVGLNNKQKEEFVSYLIQIVFGVMEICAYQKMDPNDCSLLEQSILCKNSGLDFAPSRVGGSIGTLYGAGEEEEEEDDMEDLDIKQYRESADSVFYNIFLILIQNFGTQGSNFFLGQIFSVLPMNNLNDSKNLNDHFLPIKIDLVLMVLSSIIDTFEIETTQSCIDFTHQVIKVFLNSKIILTNQRIFIDFIVTVDKFSQFLILDKENFIKVIEILLYISKNSNNQNIIDSCYIILFNLSLSLDNKNNLGDLEEKMFSVIFDRYKEIYNKYQYPNIKTLTNVISSMLCVIGISRNRLPDNVEPNMNQNYNPNLKNVVNLISQPIINELKLLIENLEKSNNDKKTIKLLRFEIVKGYMILQYILSIINQFSIYLRNLFLQEHFNTTLSITEKIFILFGNDNEVISPLIDFYTSNAEAIGESCQNNLEQFNNIILNYFLEDDNHYKVIDILKILYHSILTPIDKYTEEDYQKNKYILSQFYVIMNKYIFYIQNEKEFNEKTADKIKHFSEFNLYIFPKLYLGISPYIEKNELLKYYELTQNIILLLITSINLFQNQEKSKPIDEITLISVLKSFNSFFINITLQKEFLTANLNNNNNNDCLFSRIIDNIWKVILFKQFNCLSRSNLINCLNNGIKLNKNIFEFTFKKCLQKFPDSFNNLYVENIMEYIYNFGDNDTQFRNILQNIIEIIQGNESLSTLTFYFMQNARKKLKKVGQPSSVSS